jgi:glucosamine kinase
MSFFLGIDGGGSKTECMLGDAAHVLARASAGSCKIQAVGEKAAAEALRQVVSTASELAGVSAKVLSRICVGISGASNTDAAEFVRETLAKVTGTDVVITGDHLIAFEAAFQSSPGIIVIAGTGSIAFGRDNRGSTARAGGYGPIVSDEGSGVWIGREAIAAALRRQDSGKPTQLLDTIQMSWRCPDFGELITRINKMSHADFAAMFPLVQTLAEKGSIVSSSVLKRAGESLAGLVDSVASRLFANSSERFHVRTAGGVLRSSAAIQESLRETLNNICPQAIFDNADVEPALGALYIARSDGKRQASGVHSDDR